jgi:hypothetical protein
MKLRTSIALALVAAALAGCNRHGATTSEESGGTADVRTSSDAQPGGSITAPGSAGAQAGGWSASSQPGASPPSSSPPAASTSGAQQP